MTIFRSIEAGNEMSWYKYSRKYKTEYTVKLVSLFSWKEAGFATLSTALASDMDVSVDARDTFALLPRGQERLGFAAKVVSVNRDFVEGLPEDIAQRIAEAVKNRASDDLEELRNCLGRLEFYKGPAGTDRPGWNIYRQSGNRFTADFAYRMVFALKKDGDKLGIIVGTPTFFRDCVIKDGAVDLDLDVTADPIKKYYQEL